MSRRMDAATAEQEAADHKKRSTDAGLYLYSRLAASVLGLVTIGIATHVYSETAFAFVATILLMYDTAYALGSLGLPEAVFFFVGRDRDRAPLVVRQAAFLLLVVAVPVIGIIVGTAFLLTKPDVDLIPAIPWLAVAILLSLPTQPAINQLLAARRASAASILQTLYAVLNALAIVLPAILGVSERWTPIFLAIATSVRVVVHVVLLRKLFARTSPAPWLVGKDLRAMLHYAFPAGLATLCGKLNPQIDKYVVDVLLTTQIFAFYTAASWELPLISMIPYAIGAVMQVRYVELFAQNRKRELRELWFANVHKVSLVVFPVTMVVIVVAPELVELLFGRDYLPATLPFQLFTALLFHRVASYGAILQATNQTRALLVSSVLLIATNAILTLPLTLVFGYPGAALATLVSFVPPWLWTLSRIADAMGVRMRGVMPWGELARGLGLVFLLGGIVWIAKAWLPVPPAARLVAAVVTFGGMYLIAARKLRIISAEDLGYMSRWLSFRLGR
jgi:O-antigen/teichoic acid export membrane protein